MHCVDLDESFPTSIYLQKLASIQRRTSPKKFESSSSRKFELKLWNFKALICSPGSLSSWKSASLEPRTGNPRSGSANFQTFTLSAQIGGPRSSLRCHRQRAPLLRPRTPPGCHSERRPCPPSPISSPSDVKLHGFKTSEQFRFHAQQCWKIFRRLLGCATKFREVCKCSCYFEIFFSQCVAVNFP